MHWPSFLVGVAAGAVPTLGCVIYLLHAFAKTITIRW